MNTELEHLLKLRDLALQNANRAVGGADKRAEKYIQLVDSLTRAIAVEYQRANNFENKPKTSHSKRNSAEYTQCLSLK